MGYFPQWKLKEKGVVAPDERLPTGQTVAMGVQHVVAMFGSTILAPILMGFDPNMAVLMSGIGTLIFFAIVGGRVPSYLGSSFAFIGVVIAATGYVAGSGLNGNIPVALGGIVVCGLVYCVVGLIVMLTGVKWIEKLMPPVVTGAVVAVIGLNLAPTACRSVGPTDFDAWMAVVTFMCVGGVAVWTRGFIQKLLRTSSTRCSPTASAWASRSTSRSSPTPPGSAFRRFTRRSSRCTPSRSSFRS